MTGLSALQSFGLFLKNIADPTTIDRFQEDVYRNMEAQRRIEEQKRQDMQRAAMERLAAQVGGTGPVSNSPNVMGPMQPRGPMDPLEALSRMAAITGDPTDLINYQVQQNDPMRALEMEYKRAQINSANRVEPKIFQTDSGDVISVDPYAGSSRVLYDAPDRMKLPETTGLPEGMMWGIGEGGVPIATLIPGVQDNKNEKASVPGFSIARGESPTEQDAKALKEISQAMESLSPLLEKRKALLENNPAPLAGSKQALEIEQNTNAVMLKVKNLEQAGALDRGAVEVVGGLLGDPIIEFNMLRPIKSSLEARAKREGGKDFALGQLDQARQYMLESLAGAARSRGYEVDNNKLIEALSKSYIEPIDPNAPYTPSAGTPENPPMPGQMQEWAGWKIKEKK